ncbi:MAG: 16S rRNA (cytosine(1402)-N(4))-methyltransferase RsmH [Acidimicrobiales bacterium]
MSQAFAHRPVMEAEVVALFGPLPPGLVVDATVGGGGHAEAILIAHPHLSLLGLDRDPDAVAAAGDRLGRFGGRARVVQARFDALVDLVNEEPSGVLFDLGVSSPQLDRPERGFSYRQSGPLDMRMDPGRGPTAADLVNSLPELELARLLRANGEGRLARAIARSLVASRPLTTTAQLAEAVARAVPAPARRRGHPASRVFQALRIEVNDEAALLSRTLGPALAALVPGGRAVVLSYHSGEDRLVKSIFAEAATGGCTCPPRLPCVCGAEPWARLLNRGARMASEDEVAANRRASAARLRAAERLPGPARPEPAR